MNSLSKSSTGNSTGISTNKSKSIGKSAGKSAGNSTGNNMSSTTKSTSVSKSTGKDTFVGSKSRKVKNAHRVRWLETRVIYAAIEARSPEQAIEKAKRYLLFSDVIYDGKPHVDSFECVDLDDTGNDYIGYVQRTSSLNTIRQM